MNGTIRDLFSDENIIQKVKKKLPKLFNIAELESSRAGKIGMEVGSIREKIIVALLIYKFGSSNVNTEVPITKSEVDVEVFNEPISIKTFSSKSLINIKLSWTVDSLKALEFSKNYKPVCDIILIHISWNNEGGFYYISRSAQENVIKDIGLENYIVKPKQGTNPRGIELNKDALKKLLEHRDTLSIKINWEKTPEVYNPFNRWIELWETE